jgi:hypothetical protein
MASTAKHRRFSKKYLQATLLYLQYTNKSGGMLWHFEQRKM